MSSHNILNQAVVDRYYEDFVKQHGERFTETFHRPVWIFFRPKLSNEFSADTYKCAVKPDVRFAIPIPTGIVEFQIADIIKAYIRDGFEVQSVQRT